MKNNGNANESESAGYGFFARRRYQAAADRMVKERPKNDEASALRRFVMAGIDQLRQCFNAHDYYDEDGFKLATRASLSEPVHRDAIAPVKGKLLHEEHQRESPNDAYPENAEIGELPYEGSD